MSATMFISCLLLITIVGAEVLPDEFQRQFDVMIIAKFDQLEAKVRDQEIQLKTARGEILSLKTEVQRLESVLVLNANKKSRSVDSNQFVANKAMATTSSALFVPRTCHEALESGLPEFKESGMYWIDPDGLGIGDGAIYVYCDMSTGATSVGHDSEATIEIPKCRPAGCYSRPIVYSGGSLNQMKALSEISANCHQTIQVNCLGGPLTVNSIDYAWWNDVNNKKQTFWSGSDESIHTCQCGSENKCVRPDLECNCDANVAVPLTDNGNITLSRVLPLTKLNFGQINHNGGSHTLGKFTCSGKLTYAYPTSCADLWRIGYTLNGLYPVRGSTRVEFVHCDFSLGQNVKQEKIGYADVKTQPVHFYVQRSDQYSSSSSSVIPFNIEVLNDGGAMDIRSGIFTVPKTGTYLFDFSGVNDPNDGVLSVEFNIDDKKMASTFAGDLGHFTINLPSVWHLTKGSTVKLTISHGTLYSDNKNGPMVHLTGILLEEDIFA
ncbi:uncharacterized protein LOC130696180 [Daphnia carinata]|uniref:uncharacterized protein LOC130696180 n=1 Tax=Daphnia carinata TaxID=120202 RepID=UPI0025798B8E|nr:uncharacterized protein LOC130696180 [Daphnia carinata]